MKKITIGSKPTSKSAPGSPDDWVADRPGPDEPMKRLTIDIPASLHQRVKSQCALRGEKMADVVRDLLEKRFKPESRPEAVSSEPATETQKHDSVTFRNHDDDPTAT
jgi:hypothetical protein